MLSIGSPMSRETRFFYILSSAQYPYIDSLAKLLNAWGSAKDLL